LLLAVGLALLLVYLSARIYGAVMCRVGRWSFAALKSNPPAAKGAGNQPVEAGLISAYGRGKE
jgi:hypothetical protein